MIVRLGKVQEKSIWVAPAVMIEVLKTEGGKQKPSSRRCLLYFSPNRNPIS
jgi:hypothetical protein